MNSVNIRELKTLVNLGLVHGDYPQLFMYKKRATNFIKDIVANKQSKGGCQWLYYVPKDLERTTTTTSDPLRLCISKKTANILHADTAFVYKDNNLYIFKRNFYKMSNKVVNKTIKESDIQNQFQLSTSNNYRRFSFLIVLTTENKCKAADNCLLGQW